MSIRPEQFWLIHSPSLSIFTRTDYIWQIVTFSWTRWREAWACSWQWALSWCLMFISYSVFTFPNTACVNLYLNISSADVFSSPLVTSGQTAVMAPFHCFKKNNLHAVQLWFHQTQSVVINFKCFLDEQLQHYSMKLLKWRKNSYISKNLVFKVGGVIVNSEEVRPCLLTISLFVYLLSALRSCCSPRTLGIELSISGIFTPLKSKWF